MLVLEAGVGDLGAVHRQRMVVQQFLVQVWRQWSVGDAAGLWDSKKEESVREGEKKGSSSFASFAFLSSFVYLANI
jgi:hypothetical protein